MLADVTADNDGYRDEFFGPVAVVHRVEDDDAAVALANDIPFSLGSSVSPTGSRSGWST